MTAHNQTQARRDVKLPVPPAGALAETKLERDRRVKAQRANLFSHLGKIIYVADTIGSKTNIETIGETLAAHGAEFKAQEHYSLEQLLDACQRVQVYLPLLESVIREVATSVQQSGKPSVGNP